MYLFFQLSLTRIIGNRHSVGVDVPEKKAYTADVSDILSRSYLHGLSVVSDPLIIPDKTTSRNKISGCKSKIKVGL